MRMPAKKCECGRVTNPFQYSIVTDAWVDRKDVAHFEFNCPQCGKKLKVKMLWKL
jgi:hypothetical protein